jgi:hypothetical protein
MSRWLAIGFFSWLLVASCAQRTLVDPTAALRCPGLDETSCKADRACSPEYCSACACTPAFVGCIGADAVVLGCEIASCPALNCSCDGLDEASCIAAETTRSCTPDYCPNQCAAGSSYVSCRGPGQSAPGCGGSGGCPFSNSCRSAADCPGTDCLTEDSDFGCVACLVPGCAQDSDCSAGLVCNYVNCCGNSQCVLSCTAGGACRDGRACNSDGHCGAIDCSISLTCPSDFDCISGICGRRGCTADADCAGGFCVDGACFTKLGVCNGD